jgi:hypothetical protein
LLLQGSSGGVKVRTCLALNIDPTHRKRKHILANEAPAAPALIFSYDHGSMSGSKTRQKKTCINHFYFQFSKSELRSFQYVTLEADKEPYAVPGQLIDVETVAIDRVKQTNSVFYSNGFSFGRLLLFLELSESLLSFLSLLKYLLSAVRF